MGSRASFENIGKYLHKTKKSARVAMDFLEVSDREPLAYWGKCPIEKIDTEVCVCVCFGGRIHEHKSLRDPFECISGTWLGSTPLSLCSILNDVLITSSQKDPDVRN